MRLASKTEQAEEVSEIMDSVKEKWWDFIYLEYFCASSSESYSRKDNMLYAVGIHHRTDCMALPIVLVVKKNGQDWN